MGAASQQPLRAMTKRTETSMNRQRDGGIELTMEGATDVRPEKLPLPGGSRAYQVLFAALSLFTLVLILAFGLAVHPENEAGQRGLRRAPPPDLNVSAIDPAVLVAADVEAIKILIQTILAFLIGLNRVLVSTAAMMCILCFAVVVGGVTTATYVAASCDMTRLPYDFLQKGTVSNVAQDVATPKGRLWTAALSIASLLHLASSYTFWLYRPWLSAINPNENRLAVNVLVPVYEKTFRALWLVVPPVGFLMTAVIPSVSGGTGQTRILSMIHNVCAPLAMMFMVVMETIQLSPLGENAFSSVLVSLPVPAVFANITGVEYYSSYGPLTRCQRLRVVICCLAWIFGFVFIVVQGFLNFVTNKRFSVALTSYAGECFGLCLAFMLPALAGVDMLVEGVAFAPSEWIEGSQLAETIIFLCRNESTHQTTWG